MNARKLLATAASLVAVIGFSVAAAPAQANDFERRMNFEAMRNYMNQRGAYSNQYYGNVNRYNNWNNGWNNNGRGWNRGRHNGWNNGWNKGWNNRRHHGHHHHH